MNRYWNIILSGFALLSLLAIYVMASEMDYQQAVSEENDYCWRVQSGVIRHWNTNIDCPAMPRQVAGVDDAGI
ncbi:MAG: hypothetical protein ACPH3N_00885 [Alcanivorax sediminis]|uniref:hypothetical protein n=1 Tax=Alcanivorax sediminis TaxID=2663008 RepID=UPI003C3B9D4B